MKFSARVAALLVVTLFTFGNAHAAGDLAPLQVFTDPMLDSPEFVEATPPWQDLVAGYISETETDLIFTWQVVDIPDELANGMPTGVRYDWEFSLDVEGDEFDPIPFALSVATSRGAAAASLQSEPCTRETSVDCTSVAGVRITTSVDPVENTVTAKLRRRDLRTSGAVSGGASIAVDGAILDEATLWQGIGSYLGVGGSGLSVGDPADLDDIYVLGSARPV